MAKPRTVILTLELQDCTVPLGVLRRTRWIRGGLIEASERAAYEVDVDQVTVAVAQPSTASAAKGKRVKR